MEKSILIVDDEMRMRKLISDYFKREGFNIYEAENGLDALEKFKKYVFDLIILDIMMPYMDGYDVCKEIRKTSNVPIIFLTAKGEEDDKLLGYALDADDYVTKPFSPKVLVAKSKAILKRDTIPNKNRTLLDRGGISIDTASHRVFVEKNEVNLSPKEYQILLYFIKNEDIVLSREKLLDSLWGYDYDGDLRTVDTHVKRLREKLGNFSNLIATVRGSGYRFEVKN
ncbi:MAG: response regulator transcription factor [Clostridiaceae bacterium]